MDTPCKHPRVRVVAREEDAEYVECLECGEVFDSNEFRDMAIEEAREDEEEACTLRKALALARRVCGRAQATRHLPSIMKA